MLSQYNNCLNIYYRNNKNAAHEMVKRIDDIACHMILNWEFKIDFLFIMQSIYIHTYMSFAK